MRVQNYISMLRRDRHFQKGLLFTHMFLILLLFILVILHIVAFTPNYFFVAFLLIIIFLNLLIFSKSQDHVKAINKFFKKYGLRK